MPQKTSRLPVHVTPSSDPGTEKEKKDRELTVNKVLAGAGAAATAAAVGSYFGAGGTVTGAAIGSVVTTIGAVVYQHSLDRTRDTVRARIRLPGGRTVDVPGATQVPAPPVPGPQVPGPRVPPDFAARPSRPYGAGPGPTGPTRAIGPGPTEPYAAGPTGPYGAPPARVYTAPPPPAPVNRRRVLLATAVAALAFALGLLTITGIEFVKGSTLSTGQEGTSVGRVLQSGSSTTDRGADTADESTSEQTESGEQTDEPGTTATPAETSTPEPTVTATPTPSETAEPEQSGDTAEPGGQSAESDTGSDSAEPGTGN